MSLTKPAPSDTTASPRAYAPVDSASKLLADSAVPFDRACTLVRQYEQLLIEARQLIIERGESIEYGLQMRQHGWLHSVNQLLPIASEKPACPHCRSHTMVVKAGEPWAPTRHYCTLCDVTFRP